MKILGKSKFDKNIYDKINKNADGIEIHLAEEFLNNDLSYDKILDLKYVDEVPIYVIHMPLVKGNDVNIETTQGLNILTRVAKLADYITRKQKHNVLIVVHLSTDVNKLKAIGIYDKIVFKLYQIVCNYSKIEIGVENVTLLHQDDDNFSFENCLFDNIELVKDCNHPRIGTVLDTCHILQNEAFLNYLKPFLYKDYFKDEKEFKYDMETYFKENQPYIKLIHLANMNYNGLMKNHGTPFTKKDLDLLKYILSLYKKYEYNCMITLEVRENDYSNAKNFQETLKNVNYILKKQGLND